MTMSEYDRLSALMRHFHMTVEPAHAGQGNFIVFGDQENGKPAGVEFWPRPEQAGSEIPFGSRLLEARAEWGGQDNPLIAALPQRLVMAADVASSTGLLLQVVVAEAAARRCGSGSALNRLCEVLIIALLRQQIELGATTPGLLAGLANTQLSRALVVMHEEPGKSWRNADLAAVAGMSLSRFCEHFTGQVGETPQSYLRRWRMVLARQQITGGERVQSVARRLGYSSSEALTRAFSRHYGQNPVSLRRQSRALLPAG
jgi:AraC-like DNA-binding protein